MAGEPKGIRCNAVAPGRVLTGKPLGGAGSDPLEYSRSRTPMPRWDMAPEGSRTPTPRWDVALRSRTLTLMPRWAVPMSTRTRTLTGVRVYLELD